MRNIAFVIWMICWPLVRVAEQWGDHAVGQTYSPEVRQLAALTTLVIWIAVGVKLYEKPGLLIKADRVDINVTQEQES